MIGEILTMLCEQLLLFEGLVLGVTLGVLLWRRKYLLNRHRRVAGRERGLDGWPASGAHAPDDPEWARRFYRVH